MTGGRASAVEQTGGASFRDLEGIGAGAETRLHRVGVVTWSALDEIVGALGGGRQRTGDRLRELSDQLAERGAAAGDDAELEQRQEAFLLRLSLTDTGRPTHGTITNVRSGRELTVSGWAADDVVRFVEVEAGMNVGPDPVYSAPALAARSETAALPAALPEVVGAPTEASGAWPAPPRTAACASREPRGGTVVLDAGTLFGGGGRTIERVVRTVSGNGTAVPFRYRADLLGRGYGEPDDEWVTLASLCGEHQPPAPLSVRFADVLVPPGVQRARLRLVATEGALPLCRLAEESDLTGTATG